PFHGGSPDFLRSMGRSAENRSLCKTTWLPLKQGGLPLTCARLLILRGPCSWLPCAMTMRVLRAMTQSGCNRAGPAQKKCLLRGGGRTATRRGSNSADDPKLTILTLKRTALQRRGSLLPWKRLVRASRIATTEASGGSAAVST